MLDNRWTRPLLALILLGTLSSTARADKAVDKARDLLFELRFDEARATAEKALREGSRSPQEVAGLYMVIGEVLASMGDEKEARNIFRNALSVDPTIMLSKGASPKITEPFTAAQALVDGADPLSVRASGSTGEVEVEIESDLSRLVSGVRAVYKLHGKKKTKRFNLDDSTTIEIPDDAESVRLFATDEHGNTLAKIEVGTDDAAEEDAEVPAVVEDSPEGKVALLERWQLWGGVGLVLFAGGAYFGLESSKSADAITELADGTEFSEAKALEDDAKRKALYANIGFAAASAATLAAAWLYFRHRETDEKPRTAVVPLVSSDAAGAAAVIRF
jgi:hypothetical protein